MARIKKHRLFSTALLFVIFLFPLRSVGEKHEESNGFDEFWQELYVYSSPNERITLGLLLNNLYAFPVGNYDWFIEGGVKYKVNNWLEAEAIYRQEYIKTEGIWTYENRPMLRIGGRKNVGIWRIKNRHRFEMRHFEKIPTRFRYRTDVKVLPILNITTWNLNPYVQEELFVSEGRISRIRSYLGIIGKKGMIEPAAYFLIQTKLHGRMSKNNLICGICLGLELSKT